MRHIGNNLILLSQVPVWLFLTATVFGQAAPPKPPTEAEFTAMLQSRLNQVADTNELTDAEKAKAKDSYKQALTEMEAVKRWIETTAQNEKLATDAPKETEQTKASLAAPPLQTTALIPSDYTLLQIEQGISQREAALDKLRKALADDEEELKGRAARRAKIPEQINDAKKALADVNAQLDLPPPKDEKPALGIARRLFLMSQRRRAEQEIICRQKELDAYEKRTELLPLHRDLKAREIASAEQEIKQWREAANQRRQLEAEQQVQQASREANQAPSTGIVRELAEDNAKLAARRKPLADAITDVSRQKEQVDKELKEVTKLLKDMNDREKLAGKAKIASHVGSYLRTQRDSLPNLRDYVHAVELQQQRQSDYGLALLEWRNKAFALTDQRIQESLQDAGMAEQDGNRAQLESAVREALKTQGEYLNSLTADCENYLAKLADLIGAEAELIAVTKDCQQFIDERVLWIESAGPLSLTDVRSGNEALWWLIGPKAWLDIGHTLLADVTNNLAVTVVAILGFLLLFAWRLRVPAAIQEISEKAQRGNCYRFLPTVEAALLTTVAAVAWPAVMLYVGWRLTVAGSPDLCQWLGHGLTETARVFFALELLRRICCPRGLGESHFGWAPSALKLLRANLRWFSLPGLLLMCVTVTFAWKEDPRWDASLGRACFIVALFGFSFALHRVLRPGSAVFQAMIVERRAGWLERFRYVWYPFCTATPAALAILAAAGYQYTARQLAVRLILTAYVVVGGIVCRALLLRWTLVNQRKLAIQQAKQRRAAALNELNAGEDGSGSDELPSPNVPERDIATINTQTRRLIEFSLGVAATLVIWCAWFDVLPALNTINAPVWTTTISVPVSIDQPGLGPKIEFQDVPRKVKLADLFLAAIVLVTTVIAAKNIPGVLEMAVLQHLPFDAGARYAVATVCRYLITLVGLVCCCGIIGLGWSKVQWLVAAMGLGLGFGLQEIFANFISGLIILFERPVRVGDVITIEGVTGVVSKIRIRATTITDGDRKELIIPNKEFITGRVLNWTLSDQVNRVTINVDVAYGSDTKQVEQLLLGVARNHPLVLDDPAPGVSLESFGSSSLKFVLRCFLPNLDNRGTVIHELHMGVDREFRAAGIEMPFPQQDVHVRSIDIPAAALPPGIPLPNTQWPLSTPPTSPNKSAGRAA
jgi:potassium-dependent mechanosensitive channel